MADTVVLEATAERHKGSSPLFCTICSLGEMVNTTVLKAVANACKFESYREYLANKS